MDVWYAAYGSNLSTERFGTYLAGGRPPGGGRTYAGARDPRPPQRDLPLTLPGRLFFAWHSSTWGGGVAFYDPQADGRVLARAWLVTEQQFADVAAQEMGHPPGHDLDLTTVLADRVHTVGPGRYETLHLVGELEGRPVLTFTAPEGHGLAHTEPSASYQRTIVQGLGESHGLAEREAGAYVDAWAAGTATDAAQAERRTRAGAPSRTMPASSSRAV